MVIFSHLTKTSTKSKILAKLNPIFLTPYLFLFFTFSFTSPVWTWDGQIASKDIVPSTYTARTSPAVVKLLYKTPIEHWKKKNFKENENNIIFSEIKKGRGADQLWEVRVEPGAPYSEGTWIIFVDGLGRFQEIRILLIPKTSQKDHCLIQKGTWVRFYPSKNPLRCRMDLLLTNRLATMGWELPYPLYELPQLDEKILFQSVKEINLISLLPIHRWEDKKVKNFYTQLKKYLSQTESVWDSLWPPQDHETWTKFYSLFPKTEQTWNPWGVVLWVSKVILKGWGSDIPSLEDLTRPRFEPFGYSQAFILEESKNPSFSLNWNRNLGLSLQRTLYPDRPLTNASADVKDLPFFENLENYGYAISDLKPIIHLLAVTRPSRIYLAVINTQEQDEEGKALSIDFLEPIILLPWVGENDTVQVALFVGSQELSFEDWLAKVDKKRHGVRPDYIQLVELLLPTTSTFSTLSEVNLSTTTLK